MQRKGIKSKVVHAKIFVQRAMSYIAILNSGMILFLLLSRLEDYKIDIRLETWFIPIFFVTILAMVLFGYLEDRLGFFTEENIAHNRRNPVLNDINMRLERIEKKLGK